MRAVNLLPSSDRAQVVKPAPAGASQVLLGVLGVMVVAMLLVVFSQNQITDRKKEIAKLNAEQQEAVQKAGSLGSFGQFAQIKQTRVQSIGELAKTRFDWERLMREMALVLPKGTWLATVNASSTGTTDEAGGASPTSDATTTGTPAADIEGCAKTQSRVAETMVRLRNLHRAEDVTLSESTGPDEGSGASSTASASSSGSTTGSASCGNYYSFKAKVAFSTGASREAPARKSVPSRLGGGS